MAAEPSRRYRCAIYTRKSTEEGLEQDFNSLHAQREACEAYVRSQHGEGWRPIAKSYDDGGISGGTLDRPALKRLLGDIEVGKVDVVVVYKVDRLTRSLNDFSKIVDVFDRRSVSFVAVTQQFSTTSSMGRLTLNMLLSFAQFEREVTGERIRDKFAASKRKGIWMGGSIPRGYRVEDRKLVVVPKDAEVVRTIYEEYLKSASIRELAIALRRKGITSKAQHGKDSGQLSRGALQILLRNPIYVGLIPHKGETFPGQHEAIVNKHIWDAAQEKLRTKANSRNRSSRKTEMSLLMGKLFDEQGRRLTTSHAVKKGRRYRYYESHPDDRDDDQFAGQSNVVWRLPAAEIERRIDEIVRQLVTDRAFLAKAAVAAGVDVGEIDRLLKRVERTETPERLGWVERVQLQSDSIHVRVALPGKSPLKLEKDVSIKLRRRGVERRMVIEGSHRKGAQADPQMLKVLSLGLRFWEVLNTEQTTAIAFAKGEGVDNRYLGRTLPLAFLAPDLVETLLSDEQIVTAEALLRLQGMPISWHEQRATIRQLRLG